MDYNDNNACLGVLEGSGLFHTAKCRRGCKSGIIIIEPDIAELCLCGNQGPSFKPPTSDQVFDILVKVSARYEWFRFHIDVDYLALFVRGNDYKANPLTFSKGPLSQRLIAALAWLVINKLNELTSVMKEM